MKALCRYHLVGDVSCAPEVYRNSRTFLIGVGDRPDVVETLHNVRTAGATRLSESSLME